MSSIADSFLFGRDKTSIDRQRGQNMKTREMAENMRQNSRADLLALFGPAQQNMNMGMQAGLDLYGQSMPQGMDLFQQGNVGAQQMLAGGLPQVNNAILGLPTDMSFMQPQTLNYDTSWMQQTLPEYADSPADLLGGDPITGQRPGSRGKPWENKYSAYQKRQRTKAGNGLRQTRSSGGGSYSGNTSRGLY